MYRPPLEISQILAWADAYHEKAGRWPRISSGRVPRVRGETWRRLDGALRYGLRGIPGGSSLPRLLAEERGARYQRCLPRLTQKLILEWADAHHRRFGRWPTTESGAIVDAPGETWKAIDHALRLGMRTLPGDSSLARLLEAKRGVRNIQTLPRFSKKLILAWADAHHRRTGVWPTKADGPIHGARGETWAIVNTALQAGRRGLPGGSSLTRLLARHRGVRNPKSPPGLTLRRILAWADAHHSRTGLWPTRNSGAIPEATGETWAMVDRALRQHRRGLNSRLSLYRILAKFRHGRRGGRDGAALPPPGNGHAARARHSPNKLGR
jgi:hypothetical protein